VFRVTFRDYPASTSEGEACGLAVISHLIILVLGQKDLLLSTIITVHIIFKSRQSSFAVHSQRMRGKYTSALFYYRDHLNIHTVLLAYTHSFANSIHTNFARVYTQFYLSIHTVLLAYTHALHHRYLLSTLNCQHC